jgi:hypothetical protein
MLARIKSLKAPRARRPYLALLRREGVMYVQKAVVEKVVGIKICAEEWKNIALHARNPGPVKPVKKTEIFRNRVHEKNIIKLMQCCEDTDSVQRFAYGQQTSLVLGGK